MFIRPKFVTNSSSSAYIMWGAKVTPDQMEDLIRYSWFVLDDITRNSLWTSTVPQNVRDHHNDVNIHSEDDWDDICAVMWADSDDLDVLGENLVGLNVYEHESDDVEIILYIPSSFESVYSGEMKTFNLKGKQDFWDKVMVEAQKAMGVKLDPQWYIVGKWPGA